jgi:putative transposase
MIHIQLDETTRNELRGLRRQGLPTKGRDRLEMALLADAGWAPARIAAYLGYCYRTVLNFLHDFQQRGREALTPRRPGPAPDGTRRQQVTDLLRSLLAQERTWTARQLSEALAPHGLRLGPRQLRRYLGHLRAGYRRTASTLQHKQDPAKAAHAAGVLLNLQQRADLGLLELYYLDECGFAPSLPTGYSWALPGQRKRVKYEYPQGRRVNALAAYRPYGPTPWLDARLLERTLTSDDLLAYLKERLPAAAVPRVVVLDNASLHISKVTKAARPGLAKLGIYLYYLPAYSPELNEIEAVFKQVKHHEIPQRSHTSKAELRGSVEQGFGSYGRKLRPKSARQLRPAA